MGILNLIKPTAPEAPAADALRQHNAERAAKAAKLQELASKDAAALADLRMLAGIRDGLDGARQRRLDLLAESELGADHASALATVEAAIRDAEREEATCTERAAISERKRALLRPQMDAVHTELQALDAALPALRVADAAERLDAFASAPETQRIFREFQAAWTAMWRLAAEHDGDALAARVTPLGARHAAGDVVVPLPNRPACRALDFDRKALAKAITT